MDIQWKWYKFAEFTGDELYDILRLRQLVFVVEQKCAYLDCDGKDKEGHHLVAWITENGVAKPVSYLRVLPPDTDEELPSIGRVVNHPESRGQGLGKEAMRRGLVYLKKAYPNRPVRISAQQYLINFYQNIGFKSASEPYDEDGIPHREMIYSHVG